MASTSFAERATQGDALGTIRYGVVNGALWAIGIAWSNAIRETMRVLLPADVMDVVVAEVTAATLTTLLGAGVALIATRKQWCYSSSSSPPEKFDGKHSSSSSSLAPMRRASQF